MSSRSPMASVIGKRSKPTAPLWLWIRCRNCDKSC